MGLTFVLVGAAFFVAFILAALVVRRGGSNETYDRDITGRTREIAGLLASGATGVLIVTSILVVIATTGYWKKLPGSEHLQVQLAWQWIATWWGAILTFALMAVPISYTLKRIGVPERGRVLLALPLFIFLLWPTLDSALEKVVSIERHVAPHIYIPRPQAAVSPPPQRPLLQCSLEVGKCHAVFNASGFFSAPLPYQMTLCIQEGLLWGAAPRMQLIVDGNVMTQEVVEENLRTGHISTGSAFTIQRLDNTLEGFDYWFVPQSTAECGT